MITDLLAVNHLLVIGHVEDLALEDSGEGDEGLASVCLHRVCGFMIEKNQGVRSTDEAPEAEGSEPQNSRETVREGASS